MKETKSRTIDNTSVICESTKHWTVYVDPAFVILLAIFFSLGMEKYLIVWIAIILLALLRILNSRSSKWILTENELIIKSGFLPWRRSYFDIPIDTIFEAYYEHNLFANIFGYGHLNIRRTEGSTSSFRTTKMTKYKEITTNINSMVRELKKQEKLMNMPQPTVSTLDELYKLSQLKQQGILTDEEFEHMKQKLIK